MPRVRVTPLVCWGEGLAGCINCMDIVSYHGMVIVLGSKGREGRGREMQVDVRSQW